MKLRGDRGFSLLEVLMAAFLVPVVGFVIFSSFSSGVRLWKASQQHGPGEDVQIFFQKASVDVEQAFKFKSIPFGGSSAEFFFPAYVSKDGAPGRVRYFYDGGHHRIVREALTISQVYREKGGAETTVLQDVRSLEISYFIYNKADKVCFWTPELDPASKELPVAVRFRLVVGASGFVKTITVPAGNV